MARGGAAFGRRRCRDRVRGVLGYGVSLALFVLGLRYLGTARTGAYFSLAPFVGAALAVAILGEPVSVRLIIAGGLMGFGLWLHLTERHEHEHLHEPMEHEHRHRHDEHHQHKHAVTDPSRAPAPSLPGPASSPWTSARFVKADRVQAARARSMYLIRRVVAASSVVNSPQSARWPLRVRLTCSDRGQGCRGGRCPP